MLVIGEREAAQQGADRNFGAEQLAVGNKHFDSIAGKFSHQWKTTWNKRYKTFSTAVFVRHRLHGWRRRMDNEIDVVHLPFWGGRGSPGRGKLRKSDRKRGVDVG